MASNVYRQKKQLYNNDAVGISLRNGMCRVGFINPNPTPQTPS